jgi:membrane associated rhomboid family serine protease
MANCIHCGRELPASQFGEAGSLCAACRVSAPSAPAASTSPLVRVAEARRGAPVTTVLVGLNAAVFVAMIFGGVSPTSPTTAQLLRWGANWGPRSLSGEPWRMLTSNYLHIGILHILFNMWCLWDLGNLAEHIFGSLTYALIYTACGLAGSLGSLWWHPLVVGAGASGAIFGLAGALIAALYLGRLPFPRSAVQHTLRSLLAFAGYNLFFGAVGAGIDNSAHIGGLVAGFALGAALAKQLTEPTEVRAGWRFGVFAAAAVVLFGLFTLVRKTNGYVIPLERGVTALEEKRFDDAVRNLEEAAVKKPNNRVVPSALGSAYLHKQDYARAEPALERAVQLDSEDGEAQYGLGFARFKLGKADQAIAPLEKAAQLDPKNANVQQILGLAYMVQNRWKDAQAALNKAGELRKAGKRP